MTNKLVYDDSSVPASGRYRKVWKWITIAMALLAAFFIFCVIAYYASFRFVPLVGMDTMRQYYVYQWGSQPVGKGPAIVVNRDGRHNFFYVQVGLPIEEVDTPRGRFIDYLLYDKDGADGSEWYNSDKAVIVNGSLRFDISMQEGRHEYIYYKLPK